MHAFDAVVVQMDVLSYPSFTVMFNVLLLMAGLKMGVLL